MKLAMHFMAMSELACVLVFCGMTRDALTVSARSLYTAAAYRADRQSGS
jgi:hypothetical protein